MNSIRLRWLELLLLFVGLPLAVILKLIPLPRVHILLLLGGTLYALLVFRHHPSLNMALPGRLAKRLGVTLLIIFSVLTAGITVFNRSQTSGPFVPVLLRSGLFALLLSLAVAFYVLIFRVVKRDHLLHHPVILPVLQRFVVVAVASLPLMWYYLPDRLFEVPREHPWFWLLIMAFYPLASALPQEFLYRRFFFGRYNAILPAPLILTLSTLLFGGIHVIYGNWLAVTLATAGGFIFARTYQKSSSLLLATLEHSLYGCWIFTVGLGYYFYHVV